jgi:Helix-turn-helix domain
VNLSPHSKTPAQRDPSKRKGQRARLLALLDEARGGWVPLPEILALGIAQYNARIFELRRLGFSIENRTEEIDGVRHSWFRLVDSISPPATSPSHPPPADRPSTTADWFERQTGKPRPAEQTPAAGPLFGTATHG